MNELLNKTRHFLNSAELVYEAKDYTSSTILLFKALFAVLDLIILQKTGKSPKDHTERFRILEKDFPSLYRILDKYYPVYRDTYTLTIDKSTCDEIKKNVKKIIEEHKIQI